jgi:hypothetical protein
MGGGMRARIRAVAACLALLLFASAAAAQLRLQRGVNFEVWQNWTNRAAFLAQGANADFPDWMGRVDDAGLARLRAQGFDFVRLNVDPSPMFWAADAEPLIRRVVAATARLQAAGFSVVVDMHLLPEMADRPDGLHQVLGTGGQRERLFTRYLGLVGRMAGALAALPADRTALELINEPDQDWFSHRRSADRWPAQLAALRRAARAAAPTLALVLTGARSGGVEGLLRLDPKPYAGDPNLIWSFHYYEPMAVTHSGQPWEQTPARFLTRLPYPASALDAATRGARLAAARAEIDRVISDPARRRELSAKVEKAIDDYRASGANPAAIAADFARVSRWARDNAIAPSRILLGEFGVFQDGADPAARLLTLKATREAAEAAGFAWAVYAAGLTAAGRSFAVIGEATTLRLDPGARTSLGLDAPR